jgi:hypothetical protein
LPLLPYCLRLRQWWPCTRCRREAIFPEKFLIALTLGRILRYGRHVLAVILQHGHPVLIKGVGLGVAALAVRIFMVVRKRGSKSSVSDERPT